MDSQLETRALCSSLDRFESDVVLSEFLREMDELDRLQGSAPAIDKEPESKKAELPKPLSPHHASQAASRTLPRKRRNASWLRRKQELAALRSESAALETHIGSLIMQRSHRALQKRSRALTEQQEAWKTVAAIARQERRKTQEENARLKTELQIYTNATEMLHAQALEADSWRKSLLSSEPAFANAVRIGMITSRRLQFDNRGVFDMLESKVVARLVELGTIANEAHEPLEKGTSERVQICRGGGQDSAASVEFIWEIMELGGLLADRQFRAVRRSDNVVEMASRFTVPPDRTNSSSVSVDAYAVAKRFVVPAGLVILIESRSQWSVTPTHPKAGAWTHTTEEGGWVVVSSHDATPKACQLRMTMTLRPDGDSRNRSRSTLTGAVGDVVIPSFREIMSSHHQSVENVLLDSSRTA
jgi:hypothetical protein